MKKPTAARLAATAAALVEIKEGLRGAVVGPDEGGGGGQEWEGMEAEVKGGIRRESTWGNQGQRREER